MIAQTVYTWEEEEEQKKTTQISTIECEPYSEKHDQSDYFTSKHTNINELRESIWTCHSVSDQLVRLAGVLVNFWALDLLATQRCFCANTDSRNLYIMNY